MAGDRLVLSASVAKMRSFQKPYHRVSGSNEGQERAGGIKERGRERIKIHFKLILRIKVESTIYLSITHAKMP